MSAIFLFLLYHAYIARLLCHGAILEPLGRRLEAKTGDRMELICIRRTDLHEQIIWSRKLKNETDFVVIETPLDIDTKPRRQHHQGHHHHQHHHQGNGNDNTTIDGHHQQQRHNNKNKFLQQQNQSHQSNADDSDTSSSARQHKPKNKQKNQDMKLKKRTATPPQNHGDAIPVLLRHRRNGHQRRRRQQQQHQRQRVNEGNKTSTEKQNKQKQQHLKNKNATTFSSDDISEHDRQQPSKPKPPKQKYQNKTTAEQASRKLGSAAATTTPLTRDSDNTQETKSGGADDRKLKYRDFRISEMTDATTKLSYLGKERLDAGDSGLYRCMGKGLPSDVVVVEVTDNIPMETSHGTVDKSCPEFAKPVCMMRIKPSSSAPLSSSSSSISPSSSPVVPSSSSSSTSPLSSNLMSTFPQIGASTPALKAFPAADALIFSTPSPSSSPPLLSSVSPPSSLSLRPFSPSTPSPKSGRKKQKPTIIAVTGILKSTSSSSDRSTSSPLASASSPAETRWKRYNESSVLSVGEILNITRTTHEDAGAYECHVTNEYGKAEVTTVHYYAPPTVKIQQVKANKFIEGQDMTLKCLVWGWPLPDVTWFKDGDKIIFGGKDSNNVDRIMVNTTATTRKTGSFEYKILDNSNASFDITVNNNHDNSNIRPRDRRTTTWTEEMNDKRANWKYQNFQNYPGFVSVLGISRLKFSDRARYTCLASNYIPLPCYNGTLQSVNSTVMVRISGKLDFLWPLLGIIAEFVVLFIIIAVYERSKKKKKKEERRNDEVEKGESDASRDGTDAMLPSRKGKKAKGSKSDDDEGVQRLPMNRLRKP